MAVPSRDLGDLLVADRTETVLLFPEVTEAIVSPLSVASMYTSRRFSKYVSQAGS